MNYAIEQRMMLIDFLLANYGDVGRAELIDYFGISPAQATRDFALYNKLATNNALMNKNSKRWIRSDTFKRFFT